jgi:phenol/toluene 2-monooxygenase (NADH) P2/A2
MAQIASITLYHNDEARPVAEAILADNPGCRTLNMPGAVKYDCDDELIINRATVEQNLGSEWDPQEIHLIIISFAGNLDEDDDRISISWKH